MAAAEFRGWLGKASFFIKLAVLLIVVILIIMSAKLIMDYSELRKRSDQLREQIRQEEEKIEELKYYIASPIDERYVRKFAGELLGLVPSDEKIYVTEP